MTPPQTPDTLPTYTKPSLLPNLPPPVDPDANEEGDEKSASPDVPVVRGVAKEVRAEAKGSAAMTSLILHNSKSKGALLKVSIVDVVN
jgi:hypothetical protein